MNRSRSLGAALLALLHLSFNAPAQTEAPRTGDSAPAAAPEAPKPPQHAPPPAEAAPASEPKPSSAATATSAPAEALPPLAPRVTPGSGPFYVIPVREEINTSMLHIVRRGLREAQNRKAAAIILHMHTPGGSVKDMDEIIQRLLRSKIPTYTFVDKDAYSAGAIIALGTDEIYMAPGSVIGAATPIFAGADGVKSMGDAEREKMNSAIDALARSIAQQKKRDPKLATAMIRAESGYEFHGVTIVPTNKVLTLTNEEAEKRYGPDLEPVLSMGTVEDIPALMKRLGRADTEVIFQKLSVLEKLSQVISMLTPVLAILAMMLIYTEVNSPGFGWAGILGLALFALFFYGQNIAGLAGHEEALVFALGVVLLLVEIFLIPGFGVTGVLGVTLILASIFMSFVDRLPELPGIDGGGIIPAAEELPHLGLAIFRTVFILVGSAAGMAFLTTWLPKVAIVNSRLVLGQSLPKGVSLPGPSTPGLQPGSVGEAVTDLRPSGKITVDGAPWDVVSDGEFIDRGTRVRVVAVEGARIVVTSAGSPS